MILYKHGAETTAGGQYAARALLQK